MTDPTNTPDPISPDGLWRWDGTQWVPNAPAAPTPEPVAAQPEPLAVTPESAPAVKKSRKGLWIALGSVVVILFGGAWLGSQGSDDGTAAPVATPSAVATSATPTPSASPTPEETSEEPAPEETSEEPIDTSGVEVVEDTPAKRKHDGLTRRQMALIKKNPDAYYGDNVIVYAEVFQFDGATGSDMFLGYVENRNVLDDGYWDGSDNALFEGTEDDLSGVVEDDVVKIWATVMGDYSYETQIGGETTVPRFKVNHIAVIGSTD